MFLPVCRWGGVMLTIGIFVLPAAISAATQAPDPGCRTPTEKERAEAAARGLPTDSYQICPQDIQATSIGQSFEQWYAKLKAMSPCNKSACTLSCRTRNTGAQVCGATSRKWGSIGCHPNNNTAIFPTVSHGFGAHIELLRRYCAQFGRCTIGAVTQRWATANQGPYAAFVSKAAGVPSNQVFNPNDIDLVGRIALSMSCFEAGSLPYSAAELKQGLMMAAGGPAVSVPANVGQLLNESLTGSYAAAAPVAPVMPLFSAQGAGANFVNQTLPLSPPAQPNAVSPYGQPVSQTLLGQDNTASSAGNPAALLIAQRTAVSRGEPIVVSWTSVRTSTTKPCQISQEVGGVRTVVGEGNEGTKILATKKEDTAGTWKLTLECTSLLGAQIPAQSVSVSIQ